MKRKANPQTPLESSRAIVKSSVRAPYTFEYVRGVLIALRNAPDGKRDFTSLRKIAARYGVTHAAIQRVLEGKEPKDIKIRHALGMSHTIRADIPVCPVCDQPYEPRHKCEAKPKTPRRVYDMSNREAREIGLGLLAVLHTSPLRNAPELRRRLALKRMADRMTG